MCVKTHRVTCLTAPYFVVNALLTRCCQAQHFVHLYADDLRVLHRVRMGEEVWFSKSAGYDDDVEYILSRQ